VERSAYLGGVNTRWAHEPGEPFLQLLTPRVYGSVPTLFAAPLAEGPADLRGCDVAFLGIPWSAPVPPDRVGAAGANYAGTVLTPHRFRTNSIKYGGYLPELDLDVFEHLRFADYGDTDVTFDMDQTLANVVRKVGEIVDAGCIPLTMGGNSGPSTYSVLQAVAERAGGPVAVVNFDAHHDNHTETASERADKRNPRWGGTWAGRILELSGVDPTPYVHVGLRGPRNDRDCELSPAIHYASSWDLLCPGTIQGTSRAAIRP
jgi:guanidinopropionase